MSGTQRNEKRAEDPGDEQGGERRKDDKKTREVLKDQDILEIVFKHLDTTRLKLFRTVCKSWNEEICRELRKRGSVSYVNYEGECSTLMEVVRRSQELKLPKTFQNMVLRIQYNKILEEILSVPLELPITKLGIDEALDCRSPGSTGWIYALLRSCSSSLKSLKIPLCNIEIPESARSSWELKLPQLRELVLLTVNSQYLMDNKSPLQPGAAVGTNRSAGALSFFSQLISSAPQLLTLEVIHRSGSIDNFLGSVELGKLREIKIWSYDLDHPIAIGISRALSRINFENLTSLYLNSYRGDFDNSYVQQLLQRNSKSLESLSLGLFSFELPPCPNLNRFAVRNFKERIHQDLRRLPALPSVEMLEVDPSILFSFKSCPVSLKKVKIGAGQPVYEVREALQNLFRVFAQSATAWELPYNYVIEFCDFIAAERGGKGITSLTITFYPEIFFSSDVPEVLGNISKLHDLEELTLRNTESRLPPETWDYFNPQLLPNLHTLTYFSSTGFDELPEELLRKFKLIRTVVLLRNKRVRFDREAEEFFSKLPNVVSGHEELIRWIWLRDGVIERTNTFNI